MTSKDMTAIVLRVNDLGESDKIVTFYSKQEGKLAGIAKGAKKSKKRFSNKLEIFPCYRFSMMTAAIQDFFVLMKPNCWPLL